MTNTYLIGTGVTIEIDRLKAKLNDARAKIHSLHKAIAIHCREEVDIDFEYDADAISYFIEAQGDE